MTAIPHSAQAPVRHRRPSTPSIVGAAAFAVHFSVVLLLVPLGVGPLIANVAGFGAALVVGLLGHYRWTLRARVRVRAIVLRRFVWVALCGFVLNQMNYAALLIDTNFDYRVGLLLVLAAVAALTNVAARDWVFDQV
jgi:putative flippase GtrA